MKRWSTGIVLIFLAPGQAEGQQRPREMALPRHVAEHVIKVFEDPDVVLLEGDSEIRRVEVIRGSVAVLEGRLRLGGEVFGDVVVINGDLLLGRDALIRGNATVLGGVVTGADGSVTGRLTVHEERVRYERRGGRIRFQERRRRGVSQGRGPAPRSRISIRTETSYNRVEGLPVLLGPVLRTGGWDHLRVDAMVIWRSASGFQVDSEDVGYFVRAEQHFGQHAQVTLGGAIHSMISPIERWGLSNLESSLATVLLHRDYRDHFEREGYSAFARLAVPSYGLSMSLEFRDEDHRFVPPALPPDPWTWKHRDDEWRLQPLVAEGSIRTVTGELRVDNRNDPDDPSDGWYLHARATLGLEGTLAMPAYRELGPAPATLVQDVRPVDNEFREGFVDLRRYYRVGPWSDLRIRGLVAGSIEERPLPPQFQHALGGEGSLPGYDLLSADCGARAARYSVLRAEADATVRVPVFAGYGCDRIALFQAEYRGSFSFNFGFGGDDDFQDWDWAPVADFRPSWSIFFDAGRGWTLAEPGTAGHLGPDTAELMDAGVGFFLGGLGFYWAWPLRGGDGDPHFFVRLDHRF